MAWKFSDENGNNSGKAFILKKSGNDWEIEQTLQPSDLIEGDLFGHEVLLSGDIAFIAATVARAVYVYEYSAQQDKWNLTDKIDTLIGAGNFMGGMAYDGSTLFVGSLFGWNPLTSTLSGSVLIFQKNQNNQWVQDGALFPSDGESYDHFGTSIAVDGSQGNSRLVVGSPNNDTFGDDAGAVYVYERSNSNWIEVNKLLPVEFEGDLPSKRFGSSVEVQVLANGDYEIAIGASYYLSDVHLAGAVQVTYLNSDNMHTSNQKIQHQNLQLGDSFGHDISLNGDYLAIGAPTSDFPENSSGQIYMYKKNSVDLWEFNSLIDSGVSGQNRVGLYFGINVDFGPSLNNPGFLVGASGFDYNDSSGSILNYGLLLEFTEFNNGWTNSSVINAEEDFDRQFGQSISGAGNLVVVGAPKDGDQGDDAGAAFIYEYDYSQGDVGRWVLVRKLVASDGAEGDLFGHDVSFDGKRIVIGAPGKDRYIAIPPSYQQSAGAAYLFELVDGVWQQTQKFTQGGSGGINGSNQYHGFGNSVSLWEDHIAISTPGDDENFEGAGAVFVYERDENADSWVTTKVTLSSQHAFQSFGTSIDLNNNRLLVGASGDNEHGNYSGAAYVFDLINGVWSENAKLDGSGLSGTGPFNYYGGSVSLSSTHALIGGAGVNSNKGSAILYAYDPSSMSWNRILSSIGVNTDIEAGDRFGSTVKITDDRMFISAQHDDVNGIENAGKVFEFSKTELGYWTSHPQSLRELTPVSGANPFDYFGTAIDQFGAFTLIGSHLFDVETEDNGQVTSFYDDVIFKDSLE